MEAMQQQVRRLAQQSKRAFETALAAFRLAAETWRGLNAGSLRYDPPKTCDGCLRLVGVEYPEALHERDGAMICDRCLLDIYPHLGNEDGDLIDEDPPRPEVVWKVGLVATVSVAKGDGWEALVSIGGEGVRWSVCLNHGQDGRETTYGVTQEGEAEARRRAEEALAVMLERTP